MGELDQIIISHRVFSSIKVSSYKLCKIVFGSCLFNWLRIYCRRKHGLMRIYVYVISITTLNIIYVQKVLAGWLAGWLLVAGGWLAGGVVPV